jgi:DNA invertase Pin-like site-specific DNA recombinase
MNPALCPWKRALSCSAYSLMRGRRFDAVCFHKIDRIARRLKYILDIWDQLDEAGVTVYIIEPAIDTSDMMGRLMRTHVTG